MTRPAARALVAALVGVLLLGGAGGSYAWWQDQATLGSGTTLTSGTLNLTDQGSSVEVVRAGAAVPAGQPLTLGDTVVVTSAVRLTATGDNLAANLSLGLEGLTGTSLGGVLARGASVIATMSGPARPLTGPGPWPVTSTDNGATVTATVTIPVPASDAGKDWGTALQGLSTSASSLAWRLQQQVAGTGWSSSATAPVPAVTTDRLVVQLGTPTTTVPLGTSSSVTARTTVTSGAVATTTQLRRPSVTAVVLRAGGSQPIDPARLGLTYRSGADCSAPFDQSAGPTITPRATTTACLTVTPDAQLTKDFPGGTVQVTTPLTLRSAAPGTWTSPAASWTVNVTLPQPPAAPIFPNYTCTTSNPGERVELRWTWTGPTPVTWAVTESNSAGNNKGTKALEVTIVNGVYTAVIPVQNSGWLYTVTATSSAGTQTAIAVSGDTCRTATQ